MRNLFGEEVIGYDILHSDYWMTPPHLYPKDCFDPCPVNPTFDGLEIDWKGNVFCNPPYSQMDKWVEKALLESTKKQCKSITILAPAWTDRAWFQKIKHSKMDFLPGRVVFLNPATGRPLYQPRFGSVLIKIL